MMFKVGDIVQRINSPYGRSLVGTIGKVIVVTKPARYLTVDVNGYLQSWNSENAVLCGPSDEELAQAREGLLAWLS